MSVRLWFVRETEKARQYCRLPEGRNPGRPDDRNNENFLWIPKSVIENTVKYPSQDGTRDMHEVKVAEWFAERENL